MFLLGFCWGLAEFLLHVWWVFAVFLLCFDNYVRSTMQVLQPQGLFINKPFYTSIHKHCFYTSPAFTQKRFYTRPAFTQTLFLHKRCLYTSAAFAQDLLLHKRCLYTSAVFTQALSLHKACFYTKTFLHKTSFHSDTVFTQALSLHKHSFYTSPAFTQ